MDAITFFKEEFVVSQWQFVVMFGGVMLVAFSVNVFKAKYSNLD